MIGADNMNNCETVSANGGDGESDIVGINDIHDEITKRQKLDDPNGVSTDQRCGFYLTKKKRYCKMHRTRNQRYCAEHVGLFSNATTKNDKRIPCPLDPAHSIWERSLKSHLRKCNKAKVDTVPPPWYKKDFNLQIGGNDVVEVDGAINDSSSVDVKIFDLKDPEYYKYWLPILNAVYSTVATEDISLDIKDHRERERGGFEGVISSRFEELGNQKHIIQQSSLIGQLEAVNLYGDRFNYIEFGCGRAELSRYLAKAIMFDKFNEEDSKKDTECKFLLIDRSLVRMKMDSKIAKDFEQIQNEYQSKTHIKTAPYVQRVKVDIKDLQLDNLLAETANFGKPALNNMHPSFVGISKHLCGCATDLTLRCILNCNELKTRFAGLIVAMCCRHVCNWEYLLPESKRFLENLFKKTQSKAHTAQFFRVLTKLCSWATNGRRPGMLDNSVNGHVSGLSVLEREKIGLQARRIIDECRLSALKELGYKARLCHYVTKDISLENVCLIVTP